MLKIKFKKKIIDFFLKLYYNINVRKGKKMMTAREMYELINELKEISAKKDEIIEEMIHYIDELEAENSRLREELADIRG